VSQRNRRLSVAQEIELIHQFEEENLSFPEVVSLVGRLVELGWAWRMPPLYQVLAHRYIEYGYFDPREYEEPVMRSKIKIVVNDGKITRIIAEEGETDVVVQEEGGDTTARFTASPSRSVAEND